MRSPDTSQRAYEVQTEILRRQSPAERFQAAIEMSDLVHDFALAGLRAQHPDASERDLVHLLVERWYGVPKRDRER